VDIPAEQQPDLLAFEQRKAMMRDLVFGLALAPTERPPARPVATEP
jgi:hypothetical protein